MLPVSVLPSSEPEVGSSGIHRPSPRPMPHQQKRIMKRFKRRPLAVDFWQPDTGNVLPTVTNIKVATGSDSGADSVRSKLSGSSGAASVSASWRHSLNSLLDRLSVPSRHSTTSGTTFIYEDIELPQTLPQLYCSVVTVGGQSIKNSTTVTVAPDDSYQNDNPPNITEDVDVSPIPSVTVEEVQNESNATPEFIDNEEHTQVNAVPEQVNSPPPAQHGPARRRYSEPPPDHFGGPPHRFMPPPHPHHFAPFFVHDESFDGHAMLPPHMIPPPFAPWNAASTPIELTGWRINSSFDPSPGENEAIIESRRAHRNHDISAIHAGNLLAPEDLPHLLPEAGFSVPFARYEEDFEDYSGKGCCGWFSVDQEIVLRCFIGVICLVGIACVLVGIVLGAVTVSGTTRLTLCLLLIGVGAVLLTVSAIAFRLTSVDPTARSSLLGFLGFRPSTPSVHTASTNPYYRVRSEQLPVHPPAGFESGGYLPEFNWRPPPPSYQASVRDATLQQLFGLHNIATGVIGVANSGSPPPTYRSNVESNQRPTIHQVLHSGSRPPSYSSPSHDSLPVVMVDEVPNNNAPVDSARRERLEDNNQDNFVETSDRRRLIQEQGERERETQANDNENGSVENTDRDGVSVIDCSTAVPITFQVPPNNNEHNHSHQEINTGDSSTPRRRQGNHQLRAPPPPQFMEGTPYPGVHRVFPHHMAPLPPLCFLREGMDPRRFAVPRQARPQMGRIRLQHRNENVQNRPHQNRGSSYV